jgi:hypothetical protein
VGILILDGPESAGKSSVVNAMLDMYDVKPIVRHWGLVNSWLQYLPALLNDIQSFDKSPVGWRMPMAIWDRSWASEVVYNNLMKRGRVISEDSIKRRLEQPLLGATGMMVMLVANHKTLSERRVLKREEGHNDLPVLVNDELMAFLSYGREHNWTIIDTTGVEPMEIARAIFTMFHARLRS